MAKIDMYGAAQSVYAEAAISRGHAEAPIFQDLV